MGPPKLIWAHMLRLCEYSSSCQLALVNIHIYIFICLALASEFPSGCFWTSPCSNDRIATLTSQACSARISRAELHSCLRIVPQLVSTT